MPEAEEAANLATTETEDGWTRRTRMDVTSLLLELARALRGFCFYGETSAQRPPLLDRAFRALSGELSRAGAIDLSATNEGFRMVGLPDIVESNGVLGPLESALSTHGLRRLRLDPALTRDALRAFLDLLGQPGGRFESPECFERALSARDSTGIQINDLDAQPATSTPKLITTPPRASASLGSMLISNDRERTSLPDPPEAEKPSLDTHPLDAPAGDPRGERLRARLIELDRTIEDTAYSRRADDITIWAQDLWNDNLTDECYRALLVLADHAVGRGGRTEAQARAAAACFAQLARGAQLNDLIRRATAPGGAGIRAAQLLLQLGSAAVPVLLDRICEEEAPDRWAPLHSLVLALGDASLPTLIEAIEGPNDARARVGIRLAGESQNPAVLPALLNALEAPDLSRRIETIRALGFLPGEASKTALADALESNVESIAMAASDAMATSAGTRAVPVLLDVLEVSLRANRTNPSRRLIEVLGRLGDDRAVPRLSAILERKPLLRRAHHHAIQLAAVDALSILPTKEARRSVERAAIHAARPVRDRALMRLEALSRKDTAED
jgi:HEAT repeat protein